MGKPDSVLPRPVASSFHRPSLLAQREAHPIRALQLPHSPIPSLFPSPIPLSISPGVGAQGWPRDQADPPAPAPVTSPPLPVIPAHLSPDHLHRHHASVSRPSIKQHYHHATVSKPSSKQSPRFALANTRATSYTPFLAGALLRCRREGATEEQLAAPACARPEEFVGSLRLEDNWPGYTWRSALAPGFFA